MEILNRFLKYISIPTNSNSYTGTNPSTNSQWKLAKLLVTELEELKMDKVHLDNSVIHIRINF